MLIPQELQLSQKWNIDSGVNRDCQFSQRNLFSESIEQKYLLTCIKQNRHLNIKGCSF